MVFVYQKRRDRLEKVLRYLFSMLVSCNERVKVSQKKSHHSMNLHSQDAGSKLYVQLPVFLCMFCLFLHGILKRMHARYKLKNGYPFLEICLIDFPRYMGLS